ncbi:hypothetical protein MPSEU_000971900 [Mayamaea pseudoterrestris]|nr:hypothetical protein MPSEU_000971900 [Mayamaea pseudoterrestris]
MDPLQSYIVHNPLAHLDQEESPLVDADQLMSLPVETAAVAERIDAYSPIPDVVISQNSSPGSASDHMGILPDLPTSSFGGNVQRSNASLNAPSWRSALEQSNVPRVVSTFVSDPDMVRSYNTASPTVTQQDLMGHTNHNHSSESMAHASSASSSPVSTNSTKPCASRRKQASKPKREPDRRQKRLERNRESARLSRRRRKQYLEVLEERVTQISHDLDGGRRAHVANAVAEIARKRNELLMQGDQQLMASPVFTLVHGPLRRTSQELSIAMTFLSQQLKSFSLPPSMSFVLWLTLQSETYFRGGRAHSERLSAARIGERLLHSGLDAVTPAQSMWPLFCGEVCVSYEQEEKFRALQKLQLQSPQVWVERHVSFAASKIIQSTHDATQALAMRLGQREKSTLGILSEKQASTFLQWSNRNRDRLAAKTRAVPRRKDDSPYKTSNFQHQAANLYILNHQLQNILHKIPRSAPLVNGPSLKKLSRRPLFESLGCRQGEKDAETLSMERSHSSTGSLKRSASEMSMDGNSNLEDRPIIPTVCPMEAQAALANAVDAAIGHVKAIIPAPPVPTMMQPVQFRAPSPSPVTSMMNRCMSMPVAPVSYDPTTTMNSFSSQQTSGRSSFIPSHLNIVPEEMWPGDAEELLLNLVDDGDWAIGEGIDMDM